MRILYLTFNAPPVKNVASFRTEAYLNYLPKEGIEVDVLTRHYGDGDSIGSDFELMKSDAPERLPANTEGPVYYTGFYNYVNHSRFYRATRSLLRVITNLYLVDAYYYGWKKFAIEYFDQHLRHKKYDLIIATFNPLMTFVVAQELSKKYGIPWFAEYRDSFVVESDKNKTLLYKKLVQARALKGASKILVVSEGITDQLQRSLLKKQQHKEIVIIRNGYDELIQPGLHPDDGAVWGQFQELRKHYASVLVHTGTVYQHQNYGFFLDCLKRYNAGNESKIAIVLAGLNKDGMVFNPLLQKDVYLFPKVNTSTALLMQAEADVLILPAWYSNRYTGFIAKVFEFLWFGKHVWSSPAPPKDFAQFISTFPHVQILSDYASFETNMQQLQAHQNKLQNTGAFDKQVLTRKFWMQELANHIRSAVKQ
ncbi:glycosyltransferase [Lacibacter sp.]|uniref:glycosyltransferase n=1 Tax=Lacibacter sp. TaxID=1915409 RepID=UPI002B4ABFAC|nr:glycosyltransferase [Lacibacter sp.]HLP36110.1 glycosyltransferase [Lacibacter sp.]